MGIALISLGCGETDNKLKKDNLTYESEKDVKTASPQISKDKQEEKVLENMGIVVESGKIVIDTKKTQQFFERIGRTLEREVGRMEKNISKPCSSNIGISVRKDKIEVDLNKTKSFLENFAKGMQRIVKEINATLAK